MTGDDVPHNAPSCSPDGASDEQCAAHDAAREAYKKAVADIHTINGAKEYQYPISSIQYWFNVVTEFALNLDKWLGCVFLRWKS